MASYYYLVASLPMLRYDAKPSITVEQFLDACKTSLSDGDYRLVVSALSGDKTSNNFLRTYQHFCTMVQSALSEERARKLQLPVEKYRNNGDKSYAVTDAVHLAVANENVLDAEMSLIVLKWKYLDELTAQHTFDIEAVLSYALKLTMIVRKNLFSQEAGNNEFRRLFSNLQYDIKSI